MLVAALGHPRGAEVAAAHVRRHGHALGATGERLVHVPDVLDVLALGIAADRGGVRPLGRVVQVREARVVELQVRAAELAEPPHLIAIGGGEVGPEGVEIGVDVFVERSAAAAPVHHARRGDRQLGDSSRDRVPEERERLAEDRLRDADPAVDVERGRTELDVSRFVVERDLDPVVAWVNAVEAVDEVHVPRRAAELAVGRSLEADVLLHPHGVADRLVLARPQLRRVDAARRRAPPGRARSAGGRRRLPTWSARNGGRSRAVTTRPALRSRRRQRRC